MLARIGHSLGRLLHYQLPCWTLILTLWPFHCFGFNLHHGHKLPIVADLHGGFAVCMEMRLMGSFQLSAWFLVGTRGPFPPPSLWLSWIPGRWLVPWGTEESGPFTVFPKAILTETTRTPDWLAVFLITCIQIPWITRKTGKKPGSWLYAVVGASLGHTHTLFGSCCRAGPQAQTPCISWAKSFSAVKFFEHPNYASGHAPNMPLAKLMGLVLASLLNLGQRKKVNSALRGEPLG